jgi:outer membrane protein TolC
VQAAQSALTDAREQVALDFSTADIELDTVNGERAAARTQEQYAPRLVDIEQQRTDAGVDPLTELLQAKLSAGKLKLNHLHLESRAATLAKQLAVFTGLPVGSIVPDHASIAVGSVLLDRTSFSERSREPQPTQLLRWEALDRIRPQDLKIDVRRVGSTLNVEVKIDIPA